MTEAWRRRWRIMAVVAATLATSFAAAAADYPAPRRDEWIARDFKFNTGEVNARAAPCLHDGRRASGQPVLVLHGTTGSAPNMLTPAFAGEFFGRGQPLDASKHYIILPDAIGHGRSSKPSGLRAKFPRYNDADMVEARYRLLKEGLGVPHVRLVMHWRPWPPSRRQWPAATG